MASQWTISHHKQPTHLPTLTYGTRKHRDTQEPGHSGINATVNLQCRKPARGAKRHFTHCAFSTHQHPSWYKGTCLSSNTHVLTITLSFPPSSLLTLEACCLIKSISCASAVLRQTTFKQVLLFGVEQMGIRAEFVWKSPVWSQQSRSLRVTSLTSYWKRGHVWSERHYYLWISGEGKRLDTFIHCSSLLFAQFVVRGKALKVACSNFSLRTVI